MTGSLYLGDNMVLFRGDYKSKALTKRTPINVILPADNKSFIDNTVEDIKKPYKTLYLFHGMFGNCDVFPANTVIQKFAEDHNLAVVLPSCDNSFYLDRPDEFLYYSKYVGEELIDFTRSIFPLSDKREDTFIAGFSMGGYGALRTGLKYSEKFSAIGAISPAVVTHFLNQAQDNMEDIMISKQYAESVFGPLDKVVGTDKDPEFLIDSLLKEGKEIPDLYMAVGDNDFLKPEILSFHEFLKGKNIPVEFHLDKGEHTWEFCNEHIKQFVEKITFKS